MGWNLVRRGAEVVFIDAGQPGEGVTNWSFSWVNASNKTARKSYFDLNVAGDEVPVAFYPDEAWVHGRHLVGRLVGQAVASGAEHRSGTAVCDIGTGADGSIRTVALSDGSCLDVNIVVNAAGPSASHIAGLIARHLPMRREPGVVTRIRCAQVPVHRAMHAPAHRDPS
ncbi:FAD-dependent oxidoreductase [Streptomyces tubercidicus]